MGRSYVDLAAVLPVQCPQAREFLALVVLHPGEDIIQGTHRLGHKGTLVEHDAFGAHPHGGVG